MCGHATGRWHWERLTGGLGASVDDVTAGADALAGRVWRHHVGLHVDGVLGVGLQFGHQISFTLLIVDDPPGP